MTESADPDRLTKQEAAALLEVSERTVEQYVKDGKLDPRRWRPAGGGQWRTVFLAEDVARLAQERQGGPPAPFLMPTTAEPGNGNGHAPAIRHIATSDKPYRAEALPSGEDVLRLVFAMAQRALTSSASVEAPQEGPGEGPKDPQGPQGSQLLFVTIAEAAALTGLPRAYLRRKCQEGWSGAIKSGGWKIRRRDLEAL